MSKPTVEEYRQMCRDHFQEEDTRTDEEIQADLDDFFDDEAAIKFEKEHPEEVAKARAILRGLLNDIFSNH